MRILLWSDYFWPAIGGTEVFALNLVRGLQGQGVEFEVIANSAEAEGTSDGAPPDGLAVHRLPVRSALTRRDAAEVVAVRRRIVEIVARFRPDLVHEISLGPGDAFIPDARRTPHLPRLVTLQQDIPRHLLSSDATIGRAIRTADWIATCSHAVREELLASTPEVAARCSVVHNALPAAARRPCAPPTSPRLLCLGRLVDQKGFDVALEAFATARSAVPDVRLIIAGDGPERRSLEARARGLGVANEVDFLGWVHPDQTGALIDSVTAVVMPSRREPMGLVGLETALRGRPLIATRVGGQPEVVAEGQTGLLVAVADATALSHAMVSLLSDPTTAATMGRAARARALRLFPFDAHLAAYRALYERLCRRSPTV